MAWAEIYRSRESEDAVDGIRYTCIFEGPLGEALPAVGALSSTLCNGGALPSTGYCSEPNAIQVRGIPHWSKLKAHCIVVFGATRVYAV